MRLADARRAEQERGVAVRDPPRRRQFPHLALVDARLLLEVEVREFPTAGKWAILKAISMRRSSRRATSRSVRNATASRSVIPFSAASSSRLSSWSRIAGELQPRQMRGQGVVVDHLRTCRQPRPRTRRAGAAARVPAAVRRTGADAPPRARSAAAASRRRCRGGAGPRSRAATTLGAPQRLQALELAARDRVALDVVHAPFVFPLRARPVRRARPRSEAPVRHGARHATRAAKSPSAVARNSTAWTTARIPRTA